MTDSTPSAPRLSWPPPGLERAQGRLSTLVSVLAVGDLLLVLPLLASVATTQHFLSFGAFGSSWWVPILSTAVGVFVLAAGFEELVRLLWVAAKAAKAGHGWRLVLLVLADADRDSGFLIQGIRHYEGVAPSERKTILELRLTGTLAYVAAVVWAPFGFSLGVMMAAAGWVGTGFIWGVAVVLPALASVAGLAARFSSALLARSVRKGTAASADALGGEVAQWTDALAGAATAEGFSSGLTGQQRAFRLAGVALLVVGVLAVLPPIALTASGGLGPLLASIGTFKFTRTQAKLAKIDVLRRHAIPVDAAITPQAAGEALHVLLMMGVDRPGSTMLPPVRSYETPWLDSSSARVMGDMPERRWVLDVLGRSRGGLTRDEREFLRDIAGHPAQAEFATIAGADIVDIVGTRWTTPFPESTPKWALEIPRYTPLRRAAAMHIALAAHELSEGRTASAERAIREVMSVGLVMIDDAPFLIDNLIGVVTMELGADALVALYRATGRSAEGDRLEDLLDAVTAAANRVASLPTETEAGDALRVYPAMVTDTTYTLGLRWELFGMVTAFAGCLNLHTLVFGPGDAYEEWRARAHSTLVRMPSEDAFFALSGRGILGTEEGCGTLFDQLRLMRMVY